MASASVPTTAAAAYAEAQRLWLAQVARATADKAPANVAIDGDREAKRFFWRYLFPGQQRQLLLKIIADPAAWPRVRSLAGVPPYSFLCASDNDVLNASGVAKTRVRMSHQSPVPTCAREFAGGQFETPVGLARVVAREHNDLPPCVGLHSGERVVVDFRLSTARARPNSLALALTPTDPAFTPVQLRITGALLNSPAVVRCTAVVTP
jgi:hypothetical protein